MSVTDLLADGDLVGVIEETFGAAMPMALFVTLVTGSMAAAIYINSRSVVLTGIVTMLSGGIVVEYLPAQVRMAGYALILLAVAVVGSSIYLGRERPVR